MKPDIKIEPVKAKGGKVKNVETWYLGEGSEIHSSIGCPHEFLQVAANKVECQRCNLGLFGHVVDGKLVK